MRTSASPGSRLVVGSSGVVFEVGASVASGLVANGAARYADEAVPTAAPPRPAPEPEQDEEAEPITEDVPAPKRRGRPPKRPAE